MTINNPTETDGVLVRNPNDRYIRQLIWTPEVGADGTPHIQAWLRLQRNQTMAFVKKLYPRAHLKPLTRDAYNENTHDYAQKDDETTAGHHVISMNDPLPGVDTILYRVLAKFHDDRIANNMLHCDSEEYMKRETAKVENSMVVEREGLEKLFISPTYVRIKKRFWREIVSRHIITTNHAHDDTPQEVTTGILEREYESDEDEGQEVSGEESDEDPEGSGTEDSEGSSGD